MNDDKLVGALQENVLTLLVHDDEFCPIVRNTVTASLFESAIFRDIAAKAIDYYDQFGTAIKEHLADELEPVLSGSDKRKAASVRRTLDNLFLSKDEVNREYVVSKLHAFVRQQTLKSAIVKAVEAVEDGNIDQAEVELNKGLASQMVSFERGILFADPKQSLTFFDHVTDGIPIGIESLDKRDISLRRQEMFLMVAPAKKGKSWALIQMGKYAMINRLKVLHITLEMSEQRVAQRYIQNFFAISKRQALIKVPKFEFDQRGHIIRISQEELERPTLADEGMRSHLTGRLNKEFKRRPPLVIKQFPTGALTISMLKAYLDGLERFHKFVPDVLLVDYPDLMKIDSQNLRVDTGRIFRDLRGLVVERNMALGTATQGNRESSKAKLVTDAQVAEDYSKIATADVVVTYSQTPQEKKLGLARVYVANGRNDEDKFVSLISQSYATGQFCLESTLMLSEYDDLIDRLDDSRPRRRHVAEDDDD